MKRFGVILVLALLCAGPSAYAASITGATTANTDSSPRVPQVKVFTRTLGGKRVKEAYIIIDRGDDADDRRKRSKKFLPRCRRGLFGRVVNKTRCRGKRRHGSVRHGKRY